jgi:pimeloyl-ACP methyl ester carboxylesterase
MHPVLLLPGTLCTGAIFEHQINALRPLSRHVEVVTFRHERSIEAMADTVAHRIPPGTPAALAGFSMGGMVALALARQAPEKIAKLALINSNHHGDHPERRARRLAQLAATTDGELPGLIERDYLPRYLQRQAPEHRALILQMACELGLDCFRAQAAALAGRQNATETLRALDCPTLIIGSTEDPLCPPAVQMDMHQMVEHSDLLMLDNCGHFSMLECPTEVSHALCNWYLESSRART